MDTYNMLAAFADRWLLLLLSGFFLGVLIWVFRPGSTKTYENPAGIPFRNEDKPAPVKNAAGNAKET